MKSHTTLSAGHLAARTFSAYPRAISCEPAKDVTTAREFEEGLVPGGRIELPLSCENQILSLARLPVPPSGLFEHLSQQPFSGFPSNMIPIGRQPTLATSLSVQASARMRVFLKADS